MQGSLPRLLVLNLVLLLVVCLFRFDLPFMICLLGGFLVSITLEQSCWGSFVIDCCFCCLERQALYKEKKTVKFFLFRKWLGLPFKLHS